MSDWGVMSEKCRSRPEMSGHVVSGVDAARLPTTSYQLPTTNYQHNGTLQQVSSSSVADTSSRGIKCRRRVEGVEM
jgi:hypothetical protein